MLRVVPRLSLSPQAAVDDEVEETPEQRVRRIFKEADCVCFDVDSTVCQVSKLSTLVYCFVLDHVAGVNKVIVG